MTKSNDITRYYADKYNFHSLLTSLLQSDRNKRKNLILQNPILKHETFLTFLDARKLELKENLEKIPNFSENLISQITQQFNLIKQNILSTDLPPPRQPKENISSSPSKIQCYACSGSGYLSCSSCSGYGYHSTSNTRTSWDGSTEYVQETIPCSSCVGGKQNCWKCGGSGMLFE